MKRSSFPSCLVAGTLAFIAVGCGASNKAGSADQSSDQQASTTQASATTRPSTTETSAVTTTPALRHVSRLRLRSRDGYTAEVVVRVGNPRHAVPQSNGDLALGAACAVDAQRDAVEPFTMKVTNTTDGYSASPSIAIAAAAPQSQTIPAEAEVGYSDGPACINLRDGSASTGEAITFGPTNPLAPGDSISAAGFVILHGYYSPAHPSGDPSRFLADALTINPQAGGDQYEVTNAAGVVSNDAAENAVPIVSNAPRDCVLRLPCGAAHIVG